MLDTVHTNKERIEKIRSVFVNINHLHEVFLRAYGEEHMLTQATQGIRDNAFEADGSLQAIEQFLADRNALDAK